MVKTQSSLRKYFHPVPRRARSSPPVALPPASVDGSSTETTKDDGPLSEQSVQPRYGPPLPTELWTLIARMSSNLRSLAGTSRFFRDICLPYLFETLSIDNPGCLDNLVKISQTTHLADLVKTVKINPGAYLSASWPDALSLVSICITYLRSLVSFSLDALYSDQALLTYGLQLALLTHPTLREIAYDKFWHQSTYLRTSFERTRTQPIVVSCIRFPQPRYHESHDALSMDGFVNRIGPYLEHYSISVRSLALRIQEHAGPVESHPLNVLLSATLPGLEELRLDFEGCGSYVDLFSKGQFLSLFLAVNPSVGRIRVATNDEYDDGPAHLYLPLDGISHLEGLEEVASPELRDWCVATPLGEIDLRLRRRIDAPGCWELVGLEMAPVDCPGGYHDFELGSDVFRGIALKFPSLRTLKFKGFFDTGDSLSEFIESLASFPVLESLTFPSDYFQMGPDLCWHDAKRLETELLDAKETWTAEEERAIQEYKDGMSECSSEDLERGRPFWESTSDEKDLDPDDEIYDRLISSGLLVARPHVRRLVEASRTEWITVAARIPSLREIEWTLHRGIDDPIGTVRWTVVRPPATTGPSGIILHEALPDEEVDGWVCSCEDRGPDADLVGEYLETLPPLFRQEANFTPALTLDRFVSRS